MSLQVWLPLNGNLNNQGLSGYEMNVSTTPSYTDNGKIGKAISTGAFYLASNQIDKIFNNTALSISFWVYPHSNTGGSILFGNDSMSTNGGRKFTIFLYPTVNDLHLSWQNESDGGVFLGGVWSGVFPSNQWTHCCIAYRNPDCFVYINGTLKYTTSGVSNSSSFAYSTMILNNASNRYINDFRLYDHCLSAKEVKEISKGLICHYKLSNPYETGQNNKYSGTVAEGNLNNSVFTKTALENERGYNYKLTYTGNGNNMWFAINAGFYPFTAGKRYYYSCKVRCHSANFSMQLRASRSDNDWVTNMTNVVSSSLADGEWHEHVVSQVVNSTYDRSGSTVTCNPVLEFYTENLITSGMVYSADFDIKDVQVIESDCYVPFIDNSMSTTVVSDCSGLGNNGTKVGSGRCEINSPRYSYSFTTNSTGKISSSSGFPVGTHPVFTVNFWLKSNEGTFSQWNDVFNIQGNHQIRLETVNTSGSLFQWFNYPLGTSAGFGDFSVSKNTWYMITLISDGSKFYCYKDASLYNTTTITGTQWTTTGAFTIGDSSGMYVSISDVRIYSTALSASDIKELYNTSASVDKNGNMYAYEFKEE